MMRNGSIALPFKNLSTALQYQELKNEHTIYLLEGKHSLTADTQITASGITIKPYPGARAIIDIGPFDLAINGSNVALQNIEIMSSDGGRKTDTAGSTPADITMGWMNVHGNGFAMTGCTIHDICQLGWWENAHGGLMRDCLLYNFGWSGPDRRHGPLCYAQHGGQTPRIIDNCIFGQTHLRGLQFYGSTPRLNNLTLNRFVAYHNSMVIGGEAKCPSVAGIVLRECVTFGVGTNLGYGATNLYDLTMESNYWGLPNLSITNGWQTVTETGTVSKSSGDNDVFVYPCVTAPRVAHIAVFNWQQLAAVSVDVSALSLTTGATYRLRNALDPLADYEDFAYDGSGALSINMTARSVATPIGAAAPLVAWDVRFGAFVLETV